MQSVGAAVGAVVVPSEQEAMAVTRTISSNHCIIHLILEGVISFDMIHLSRMAVGVLVAVVAIDSNCGVQTHAPDTQRKTREHIK